MLPFNQYPGNGAALLGQPGGSGNCRYGYCLKVQLATGQTECAYCGVSLIDTYHHWLLLSVDHVVPRAEAIRLGVPKAYYEDIINLVVSCSGCNGFGNRYSVATQPMPTWPLETFLALRDRTFLERATNIAERRERERQYFESMPWSKTRSHEADGTGA